MKLPDRRGMERFPLAIASCRMSSKDAPSDAFGNLRVENICAGGAFVITEKTLPIGTDVTLDLILSLKDISHFAVKQSHVSVMGEVIRTGEKGMAIGFGRKYKISPYSG